MDGINRDIDINQPVAVVTVPLGNIIRNISQLVYEERHAFVKHDVF
jgi:hypothetical protein